MYQALCAAAASVLIAAGCTPTKEPAPKPSKPVITATVVKLCVERAFDIRHYDFYCGPDRPDDCCVWAYVSNTPNWPAELPAVGETLRAGRGFPQPPVGSTPVTIPPEGAVFTR